MGKITDADIINIADKVFKRKYGTDKESIKYDPDRHVYMLILPGIRESVNGVINYYTNSGYSLDMFVNGADIFIYRTLAGETSHFFSNGDYGTYVHYNEAEVQEMFKKITNKLYSCLL